VHIISVCNEPHRPTQPPTLYLTGNEYRSKCGHALRLGSKGRMAHSICGYKCRWQVKLSDPSLTRATPSASEVSSHEMATIQMACLQLFLFLLIFVLFLFLFFFFFFTKVSNAWPVRCHVDLRLPSQPQSVTAHWHGTKLYFLVTEA